MSALSPPQGIDELVAALREQRAGADTSARRLRARRANALSDYAHEHGEHGLRALGGRLAAEQLLQAQDPQLDTVGLVAVLEQMAGVR